MKFEKFRLANCLEKVLSLSDINVRIKVNHGSKIFKKRRILVNYVSNLTQQVANRGSVPVCEYIQK